jgi:cytochrome c
VTSRAAWLLATLGLGVVPPAVAHGDAARGERVFQRCYACHSVEAGENKLPGPNLRGVLGRRAGSLPGFRYSPAMIEAGTRGGLVWTRETLDRFLADPERMVPGTEMGLPAGLANPDDRRDVVDFIERASQR